MKISSSFTAIISYYILKLCELEKQQKINKKSKYIAKNGNNYQNVLINRKNVSTCDSSYRFKSWHMEWDLTINITLSIIFLYWTIKLLSKMYILQIFCFKNSFWTLFLGKNQITAFSDDKKIAFKMILKLPWAKCKYWFRKHSCHWFHFALEKIIHTLLKSKIFYIKYICLVVPYFKKWKKKLQIILKVGKS